MFFPEEDALIEPDDIGSSPRIKDNLQIHTIKLFSKMATDKNPFFKRFFGERSYGQQKIATDDKHCGSCPGDYEPTGEWLRYPRCLGLVS